MEPPVRLHPFAFTMKKSCFTAPLLLLLLPSLSTGKPRLNLSNLLGAQNSAPAYERILSQPTFQVTTPWGSPYMLFEKYTDEERVLEEGLGSGGDKNSQDDVSKFSRVQQKEGVEDTRPVSLYFM